MSPAKAKRDSFDSLLHQEIEIKIEKMSITGEGVARHNGAVVFVPWSAPGDLLKVKIDFAKKNYFRGQIIEILQPGPSRIVPPCAFAGRCGGCTWQHISRAEQLSQKQNLLEENLRKFLKELPFDLKPIIPSPLEFGYRNRIQPRRQENQLGFYGWKSHDLVLVDDCHLVEEPLRAYFKNVPIEKKPKINPEKTAQKIELYIGQNGAAAYRVLEDELEDQLFAQVNRFQNENLIETLVSWSKKHKPQKIYDLYAGSGNFSFPLSAAHKSAQVIGVELNRELVSAGQKTAQAKGISPQFIEFYSLNVDHFLKQVAPTDQDLVVLDPPRGGTSQFSLDSIAASGLKKLIYVSCHAVSLSRDLDFLNKSLRKRHKKLSIEQIQAFEMFPQTHHLETLVELSIDSL